MGVAKQLFVQNKKNVSDHFVGFVPAYEKLYLKTTAANPFLLVLLQPATFPRKTTVTSGIPAKPMQIASFLLCIVFVDTTFCAA